jgi:hypothetical protein
MLKLLTGNAMCAQRKKDHLQFAKNANLRFANLAIRLSMKMSAKLILGN